MRLADITIEFLPPTWPEVVFWSIVVVVLAAVYIFIERGQR